MVEFDIDGQGNDQALQLTIQGRNLEAVSALSELRLLALLMADEHDLWQPNELVEDAMLSAGCSQQDLIAPILTELCKRLHKHMYDAGVGTGVTVCACIRFACVIRSG